VEVRGALAPAIPFDVATCNACLDELFDPTNRRFEYPFITCAECGPRFTIVREVPYDRQSTTMAAFAMCEACRDEYENPRDRRFHAETIACPRCGPTLTARRFAVDVLGIGSAALESAIRAIRDGKIVAIKALGGYHLACDATAADSVERLRQRKRRAAKPFAVMVRDLTSATALCIISRAERRLLASPSRPIVLLQRRADATVAPAVSPGQPTLGVMLPSTPLHHLLLAAVARPLVMTSGNRHDEPVAITDEDAFGALSEIADLFLMHDRPIAARCDDSVVRVGSGGVCTIRRSRGAVPNAIRLARPATAPILALGGQLKNTICMAFADHVVLSAHVGDLETWAAQRALREAIAVMQRVTGASPTVIAHDLHPEYASTRMVSSLAKELRIERSVSVQHHHAHVAACVAELGVTEPVIGVAFDGTGLGTDGAIWGGEFLVVDGASFKRSGHLSYVSLPGGDAAVRRPWRSALAHLAGAACDADFRRPVCVDVEEWSAFHRLCRTSSLGRRTSSVGRLFDAVASLLGICHVSRFEGEAAMALEAIADGTTRRRYSVSISGDEPWSVDAGTIIRGVADDIRRGRAAGEIAGAFHNTLTDVVAEGCARLRAQTNIGPVVLTGGVFMNARLLTATRQALGKGGHRVFIPHDVPCNDGGLALGQAWVAARALEEEPCV
jgi:hydrogenase maturation protein HypF